MSNVPTYEAIRRAARRLHGVPPATWSNPVTVAGGYLVTVYRGGRCERVYISDSDAEFESEMIEAEKAQS